MKTKLHILGRGQRWVEITRDGLVKPPASQTYARGRAGEPGSFLLLLTGSGGSATPAMVPAPAFGLLI